MLELEHTGTGTCGSIRAIRIQYIATKFLACLIYLFIGTRSALCHQLLKTVFEGAMTTSMASRRPHSKWGLHTDYTRVCVYVYGVMYRLFAGTPLASGPCQMQT